MSATEEEEQLTAAQVIANLNNALVELKETEDYLSYATLIDVYLSDATVYSDEEKSAILTALSKILEENVDLVYEIGWDLPELLLGFFNTEWDFQGSLLGDTDLVRLILLNFDIIAKNGNPKELFIKAIELLGSIDYSEGKDQDDSKTDRIRDVKIHTLIELLSSSLKRVKTIYPSKFLSMALTALLRLITGYTEHSSHGNIITRRLYAFARNYIPPSKPEGYLEEHGITQEEAQKIEDDENYLQRTLLQSFVTHTIAIPQRSITTELALELYRSLQDEHKGLPPKPKTVYDPEESSSSRDLLSRLYNLAISFDIDVTEEFNKLQKESVELFERIDEKKSEDDKIQDLIKFSVNDRIANLYNPDSKVIALSNMGLLYSITFGASDGLGKLKITPQSAIALTIRLLSPSLLSEQFKHVGCLDNCIYWNWVAIVDAKFSDLKVIPHYQIVLYLQILIYFSATTSDARYRLVIFTLLTRVLSLLDETTSYNFIIDTLTTAPFENAKSGMIYVLKDMILRKRPSSIDELTKDLETAKLNDSNKPPALPPRSYIELNDERIEDIYALVRESIDQSFSENSQGFQTLLGYLNFLIGVQGKFPSDKIKTIVDVAKEKINSYDTASEESSPIGLISLSLETLEGNLKK